jgi:hypothetical protein
VVFIRLQKWFVVLALVVSIGGHWAILQSVAWVGMAVSYSKSSNICQALEKTFDGKHLCKLCKLVRAGKKAESSGDLKIDLKKIDLFADAQTFFVFESPPFSPQIGFGCPPRRTIAPLLPPPVVA